MVFVLVAAIGVVTARWLSWPSLVAISMVLAVAVGLEGAIHFRPFFKVLKRGLEVNATFQGAYLVQVLGMLYVPHLLRKSGK